MNILVLSGSNAGNKTQVAMTSLYQSLEKSNKDHQLTFMSLLNKEIVFSDGRNYLDYSGDTLELIQAIMDSDFIFIGTPIFQASIPASLKNVFDLLPQFALENKTVALLVTAGSNRHFLMAEQQIKPILTYLKANIVPQYVYLTDKDYHFESIQNDDVLLRIERLIQDSLILAETFIETKRKMEEEIYGF